MYKETQMLLKQTAEQVCPIIDAGTTYEPTVGQTWVRATFLPGKSTTMSLGPEHYSEYQGLYRLDIFITKGDNESVANDLADKFIKAFKQDPMIKADDYNVYDENVVVYPGDVWREASRYESVWVNVPVYVSWKTMIQHTNS